MKLKLQWPVGPKRKTSRVRVGIDIGNSAVKILQAEVAADGQVRVVGSTIEPVAEPTAAAQQAALQQAVTAAALTTPDVRLSIAGQDIITRYLTLPKMTEAELDGAIRFEGESYIPFPLSDVVLDKQILESLNGEKIRVLLVAGKRETIQNRLAWATACTLHPVLMDVDVLTMVNAYLADQDNAPAPKTTALVQVGARYTNVAVLRQGLSCCFTRDLTIGGADLTKGIAEQLSIPAADAEQLKAQPGDKEADVTRAMQRALELLVSELRLSFDFYESQFEGGVEQMVVTGGTSLVPLVPPFLKEQLGIPVEVWTPQRWLTRHGAAQVSKEAASRLAVCVGLVVRETV